MLDLRLQRARNTLAQPGEKGLLRRIEADGSQAVRQGVAAAGQLHHLLQCLHPIGIAQARRAPAGLPTG
jgi:hypothetical protein